MCWPGGRCYGSLRSVFPSATQARGRMLLTDPFNHRRSFRGQRSWCYINSLSWSLGLAGRKWSQCCGPRLWVSAGHPTAPGPGSRVRVMPRCDWFSQPWAAFDRGGLCMFTTSWTPPHGWASFRAMFPWPDLAWNSQVFFTCIFQARDLCISYFQCG